MTESCFPRALKNLAALTLSATIVMGMFTLIIFLVVTYNLHNNLIATVILWPTIFWFMVFVAFKVVNWSFGKIFGEEKSGGDGT